VTASQTEADLTSLTGKIKIALEGAQHPIQATEYQTVAASKQIAPLFLFLFSRVKFNLYLAFPTQESTAI
jgi:hypothetical protein